MLYQGKKGNVTFGTTYASYVCHKDGHMSKECPDKKHYKGGSSKGKYKGKYKKGKRFAKGRHIWATEISQSNEEKVINALMKKLTKEQQINMLINMEQDF